MHLLNSSLSFLLYSAGVVYKIHCFTSFSTLFFSQTVTNQALYKLQGAVCLLFREYLGTQNFVEIHTPKIISGQKNAFYSVKKKFFKC